MKENLKIALVQSDLHWENPTANLAMFEEKLWQLEPDTDLIILPEMFNSGFTMNVELVAEPMNLTTTRWLKQMAAQTKAVIVGSIIVKEGQTFHNRLLWVTPEGNVSHYDKRHLFRMGNEHKVFSEGKTRLILELKGWKICPLICYDLRFPVWSRNKNLVYDLLIYVANWPAARMYPWDSLLVARAIENQSFVAAVNRIGNDGNGIAHSGNSAVIDFMGNVLAREINTESIIYQTLSKKSLEEYRQRFPAYLDADAFEID